MAAGIVGVSVGSMLIVSALAVGVVSDSGCTPDGFCSNSNGGVVLGLGVTGVVLVAIGVPLLVYGARKVPVRSAAAPPALPVWAGAPSARGWRWQF
jgi:hypothetical protein